MPDVDGYEMLHLLVNTPETCQILFIFSTSIFEIKEVKGALALGANNLITKPYDIDILKEMIRKLIESGSKRLKG